MGIWHWHMAHGHLAHGDMGSSCLFPISLFISLVCLFPLRATSHSHTAAQIHTHTQIPDPHLPHGNGKSHLPHGKWGSGTGTWHMAHGHLAHGDMGTWANQKPGNAHHNGIGEISCSMCLIVASERKFRRSAMFNWLRVTFHLPFALKPWN
jgi:hypothetical protein